MNKHLDAIIGTSQTVAGLTVRPMSWIKSMEVLTLLHPLMADPDCLRRGDDGDPVVDLDIAFAKHALVLTRVYQAASGLTDEQMAALTQEEGEQLSVAVVTVNPDFFVRKVFRAMIRAHESTWSASHGPTTATTIPEPEPQPTGPESS